MENKQLIKGSLNVIIMKLLSDNERMYGYEIAQRVKEITQGDFKITEGALYPALHKLESEGLIRSESLTVSGRIRKYYLLSQEGHRQVSIQLQDVSNFLKNLSLILKFKPTT